MYQHSTTSEMQPMSLRYKQSTLVYTSLTADNVSRTKTLPNQKCLLPFAKH